MKAEKKISPPSWAQTFMAWYCKPELLEDLQGDLNEYFERHVKSKGIRKARMIYAIDVLKFMRIYTIRKPKFIQLLIHWIMIKSYIKTSGRSIIRNKLFSTINIVGLAISMSVGLLMISMLSDLFSYDQFHEKKDRIYRVISRWKELDGPLRGFASTSIKAGRKIKTEISGIEDLTTLRSGFGGDVRFGDNIIPLNGFWADESFNKVFSFPFQKGDPTTALKEPYSIVLTEKAATKLFGTVDAIGKNVGIDTLTYTVTGVLKDIPKFSHLQFEVLGSFSTAEILQKNNDRFLSWLSIWSNFNYVVLSEGTNPESLQSNLNKLSSDENALVQNESVNLEIEPLSEMVIAKDLSNIAGPAMPAIVIWIIGGLAVIVILSACFNYTNLSIARSLRRSREVGIRKVIGAQKGHVISQFISEAVMIALMALALSFVLFLFIKPQFISIAPEIGEIVSLEVTPLVVGYFILLAIGVGTLAGFLPSIFFSRINAVQVLKDASTLKIFRKVTLRKAMIVTQYTVSLIFIASTIIGFRQYKGFLTRDLGFNTANILNVRLQGNKADLVAKELRQLPEVTDISKSLMVTSVGTIYSATIKYIDKSDSSGLGYNMVDENYFPLHGHKLLAGRNFSAKPANGEETEVIVNEQVLKRFNIKDQDPMKAIGEIVSIDGKNLTIIGVLKDFYFDKADHSIEPAAFRYLTTEPADFLNVKVESADWPQTFLKMEAAWKKIDKVHVFTADFYDDQIKRAYSELSAALKILGFLAFLAVSISSLGLLGMVVFTTETKLKEMSIRKVMGAGDFRLIYQLSKGFVSMLLIAALIALPITYLFFDQVVLASNPNRLPITIGELLLGVVLLMGIALLLIGSQAMKVVRANPAEVLKNE